MNIEQINELFKCKFCKEIYNNPVILSCGHKICTKDVESICNEQIDGVQKANCHICNEIMSVPKNGFLIDKDFSIFAIMSDFRGIDFGDKYKRAKISVESFKHETKNIELLINDTDCYISDYFNKIKREIALEQDEITKAVEIKYAQLLEDINILEFKCVAIKQSKCVEKIDSDIKYFKSVLDKLSTELTSHDMKVDEKKWDEISFLCDFQTKKLKKVTMDLKSDLLLEKDYSLHDSYKKNLLNSICAMKIDTNVSINDASAYFGYYEVNIDNFKAISNIPAAQFKIPDFSLKDLNWSLSFTNIDGYNLECLLTCDLKNSSKIVHATFLFEQVHTEKFQKNKCKKKKNQFRYDVSSAGYRIPLRDLYSNGFYDEKKNRININFYLHIDKIKEN